MELVPIDEGPTPKTLPARERKLLLASKGADIAVIKEAAADDRPSRLLAPTMVICRKEPQELHVCEFHKDGEIVMAGGSDGIIEFHNVYGNCIEAGSIRTSKKCVRTAGYLNNGTNLYSGGDGGELGIWDIESGGIVRKFCDKSDTKKYHQSNVIDSKVSQNNHLITSVDDSGVAFIWDLRVNKAVQRLRISGGSSSNTSLLCAEWGRDDSYAYYGTDQGTVIYYDLRKGEGTGPIEEFGRSHEIEAAFDGEQPYPLGLDLKRTNSAARGGASSVASGLSLNRNVKRNLAVNIIGKGRVYGTTRLTGMPRVTGLSTNPGGRYVASFSSDGQVRIFKTDYNPEGDRLVATLDKGPMSNFEKPNLKISWRFDNRYLAVGSADKKVYVYKNLDRLKLPSTESGPYGCLVDDKMKTLLERASRPVIQHELSGHISCVTSVAWHPSESIIGSVGTDGQIILGEIAL